MQRTKTHSDGPVLSRIIAGAWRWHTVTPETVDALVRTSLDLGITTFDNADIYGDHSNEEIFGNVIRRTPSLRDNMELVTKCGIKFPSAKRPATWMKHYDTSKSHIIWSAENSLRMLQTDRIDILLIHRPSPLLDPEEVAETFTLLRDQGKVLHFGVSNFTTAQMEMLQRFLPFSLVTNQLEISLTQRQTLYDSTLDYMIKERTSPMAWSPLGGGNLMMDQYAALFHKASAYRATNSQLSLAWLLKHPSNIFPVIGTTKPERIAEAAAAIDVDLDVQDWFDMLRLVSGHDIP